ncbi:YwaF family protein [[Clostridium] dakarense]|uniref:YwaF family protein n=1 Tax=Faecalimicrobium dakarense TaxID=1301100 RepID=UPI0004B142CA|nr:TIGR02206 family membrane protein [[Clostridium] dakarense]
MENISNFFTTVKGDNHFVTFGPTHLFILSIALVITVFICIRKTESRKFELFTGSILILQQLFLYSWYFIGKYNTFKEGLPLYHCRIAIIFMGIGMILSKDILMKIGSYWGIFGSIGALLFPGLDPFTFPHITQFSYFIGHLFLLCGAVYLLSVKKIGMSKSDLKNVLIFTNIYHVLMFVTNNALGSNYGYMSSPPIHIGTGLNHIVYALLVMTIFNIILFIEYILINKTEYGQIDSEYSVLQEA